MESFKKSVNIEHYLIDQDTEYAVEEVLEYAKAEGVFDETPLRNFLAGGDVIRFLQQVEDLAFDLIGKSKNPRKKWRLKSDLKKISRFKEKQLKEFLVFGEYEKYPAHKGKVLSAHLSK